MKKKVFLVLIFTSIFLFFSIDSSARKTRKRHRRSHRQTALIQPQNEVFHGIDVSAWQQKIDWKKLVRSHQNIQFAYIRATHGIRQTDDIKNWTEKDSCYLYNITQAKKNGLMVGSYHFYMNGRNVDRQFRNFKQEINRHPQDLLPMIDVEEIRLFEANIFDVAAFDTFLSLIEKEWNIKPLIYTNQKIYNMYFAHNEKYAGYHFFIARYEGPLQLIDQREYILWQYSSKGRLQGIDKNKVDLIRLHPQKTLDSILWNRES
jgi:lysozyme